MGVVDGNGNYKVHIIYTKVHKDTMKVITKQKISHGFSSPQPTKLPKAEFDFQLQLILDSAIKSQHEYRRTKRTLNSAVMSNGVQKPLSALSRDSKVEIPHGKLTYRRSSRSEMLDLGLTFKNYVAKILANEQTKERNVKSKTEKRRGLKGLGVGTNSSYKMISLNFNSSKVTTVEEAVPSKSEQLTPIKTYSHGLYEPNPLMSRQKLTQKVQLREKFIKEINQFLPSKERPLFILLEDSRTNLLKHPEWFRDTEAQKNVYLILTQIEEKWLRPFITTELKLLTEEKNRLEEELKRRAIKKETE